MARVIGSTFRRPFTVQPRQESSLERNLAQFASPQGVYLLAKGIGSLGGLGLPWGGSEGGLGDEKVRLAAAARAQALDTVAASTRKAREAKNAAKNAAVGAVDPGLRSAIEKDAEGWQAGTRPEIEPLSEAERGIIAEHPDREPLRKPERDQLGSYEMENLRAYEEGRSVRKEEDRKVIPGQLMGAAEEMAITEGQLMGMEEGELLELARAIPERNKMAKNEAKNYFKNWSESGQDPDLAMTAIGESRDNLKQYNQRIIGELTRRNTLRDEEAGVIRDAPDSVYESGIDPIFSMAPNAQRAEIRRLAKSARTSKDTERVRSLLQRHTPELSTFGDLFTSESDRRKEFETEVEDLFPAIDPFYDDKKRKYATDELVGRAQIAKSGAEAERWKAMAREDKANEARKGRLDTDRVSDRKIAADKVLNDQSNKDRDFWHKVSVDTKPDSPHNYARVARTQINDSGLTMGGVGYKKLMDLWAELSMKGNGVIDKAGYQRILDGGLSESFKKRGELGRLVWSGGVWKQENDARNSGTLDDDVSEVTPPQNEPG